MDALLRSALSWRVRVLLVLLALVGVVLGGQRLVGSEHLQGDGVEYLLMTHALATHGSPVLSRDDFKAFHSLPPPKREAIGFNAEHFDRVQQKLREPHPGSYAGFASVDPVDIHAIHFWLHSLLAVPFYWLIAAAGGNPVSAFTLVNVGFIIATAAYLRRYWERSWSVSLLLLLCAGTSFYLRFSGPEIMAACSLFVATLAIFRQQTAFAMLVAGVAASQNPSLVMVMPVALAARLPGFRTALRTVRKKDVAMAAIGMLIALAPFAYFQWKLGVPSIPGAYFADVELIGMVRMASLLFDLDQGMVVGIPGVLCVGWLALTNVRTRAREVTIAIGLFALCAVPTLAAINWNSGGVVVARYGYWLAMPFVALLAFAIHESWPRARVAAFAFVALQLAVLAHHKVFAQEYSYTQRTALASIALNTSPRIYHPDPEIFFERGTGVEAEAPLSHTLHHLHRVGVEPVKLLVSERAGGAAGHCPDGELLVGSDVVQMARGWQYHHAPFRCLKSDVHVVQFGADGGNARFLKQGWSGQEATGVWTDGELAQIDLVLPAGQRPAKLFFSGGYYPGIKRTRVSLNGRDLGKLDLDTASLVLSEEDRAPGRLRIVLEHKGVRSPKSKGESGDGRRLGYFLKTLHVQAEVKR